MSNERRKSDIELAVLASKVESLSTIVEKHMEQEEQERKEIWNELRKLDKRMVYIAMPLLTAAGAGGIAEIGQLFGIS